MPVEFLISRRNNQPVPFDKQFENLAMHRVAKLMWQKFHDTDQHFIIIFNVQDPPMDMAIISEKGIGILDFKNFFDPVSGEPDQPWHFIDNRGDRIGTVQAGANHKNPFLQVKHYKAHFEDRLNNYIHLFKSLKGIKFGQKGTHLQGCIVPTGTHVDISQIKLSKYHSWFTIQWPEDIPAWADALTFGGRKLPLSEITFATRAALSVEGYPEIQQHLSNREVYGSLWITYEGKDLASYSLDQDQVTIGRSSDNLICLSQYDAVSGHHAIIEIVNDKDVYLRDDGSTNGTFLNGKPVDKTPVQIKSGDTIILGRQVTGKPADDGSCRLVFRTVLRGRDTTRYQSGS
jgi:hypothetical protein